MKVEAIKKTIDSDGSYVLLIRARDIPPELGGELVSLSRNGEHCHYALRAFSEHDDHAPPWNADGTAPVNSSAPNMTAEKYLARIRETVAHLAGEVKTEPIKTEPIKPVRDSAVQQAFKKGLSGD